MEHFINISLLNDFIFCPYSIYLHNAYMGLDEKQYHDVPQTKGKHAHQSIDHATHNTSAHILLGTEVYSEHYALTGKIDLFDIKKAKLTERKRTIKTIYDGYKLQLYAQYYCLTEMGYEVKILNFHSLTDNKNFPLPIPDAEITAWFEDHLFKFKSYHPSQDFLANPNKCHFCIYNNLCDKTA